MFAPRHLKTYMLYPLGLAAMVFTGYLFPAVSEKAVLGTEGRISLDIDRVTNRRSDKDSPRLIRQNSVAETKPSVSQPPLEIVVFFSSDCEKCEVIERQVIPQIEKTFSGKVAVHAYDLAQAGNYEKLVAYEKAYRSSEDVTAKMFVGNAYLAGPDKIAADALKMIEGVLAGLHAPLP